MVFPVPGPPHKIGRRERPSILDQAANELALGSEVPLAHVLLSIVLGRMRLGQRCLGINRDGGLHREIVLLRFTEKVHRRLSGHP